MACGIRPGFCTMSRRCSGTSASVLPAQPNIRVVVSEPAVAMTVKYSSNSSRRSLRTTPVSSSNSAFSRSVMMSSDGFLARQSTNSANTSPVANESTVLPCRTSSPWSVTDC